MKKIVLLFTALSLALSMAACGSESTTAATAEAAAQDEANTSGGSAAAASQAQKIESGKSEETLEEFLRDAVLDETVMMDEDGIRITATGLSYTDYSVSLELLIENNSGRDLSFISGSLGYSCNSVNGYMIEDGYLNCDVADGKKANAEISFGYESLMLFGIHEIADIEIGFDVVDEEYNHIYSGPRQVTTSAYENYDYSTDCYLNAITSRGAMNTYNYDMTFFSKDILYEVNGIRLLSEGMMINRDGETQLLLEMENTTDELVYVTSSDIAINGLNVYSSIWSSDAIGAGRKAIVNVNLSSVFDTEYWPYYGISEIGSVGLSIEQHNAEGAVVAEAVPVEAVIPDVTAAYDEAGTEVYNSGSMRIVAKAVADTASKSDLYRYVLLLAENTSGRTITIDDVYNSLSVNGFMTDYSFHTVKLADGEAAAIQIGLLKSSLEDNDITSAEEITEIEIGLELKEDWNTIEEPTITVSFLEK